MYMRSMWSYRQQLCEEQMEVILMKSSINKNNWPSLSEYGFATELILSYRISSGIPSVDYAMILPSG